MNRLLNFNQLCCNNLIIALEKKKNLQSLSRQCVIKHTVQYMKETPLFVCLPKYATFNSLMRGVLHQCPCFWLPPSSSDLHPSLQTVRSKGSVTVWERCFFILCMTVTCENLVWDRCCFSRNQTRKRHIVLFSCHAAVWEMLLAFKLHFPLWLSFVMQPPEAFPAFMATYIEVTFQSSFKRNNVRQGGRVVPCKLKQAVHAVCICFDPLCAWPDNILLCLGMYRLNVASFKLHSWILFSLMENGCHTLSLYPCRPCWRCTFLLHWMF